MRLWHYKLISYLPDRQLIGQWRELNVIFKRQFRFGLINYVYDYDKEDLEIYSTLVLQEMIRRNYKFNLNNYNEYFNKSLSREEIKNNMNYHFWDAFYKDPFIYDHNNEYLTICYYNLREKHLRGQIGFTDEIWNKLDNFYQSEIKEEEK